MKTFVLLFVSVIASIVLLQSCLDFGTDASNGACDAGRESVNHVVVTDATLKILLNNSPREIGNVVYTFNNGSGTVLYYIHYAQENICSKEHFTVNFTADVPPSATDSPQLKVYGEVSYSGFHRPYSVVLFDGVLLLPRTLFGDVSVGLKQTYEGKPGSVEIFLKVEFPSKGTAEENEKFFRSHFSNMNIKFSYDKHK